MMTGHKKNFYERWLKRPLDFFFSLLALTLLSPVFLILSILVKIKIGSPIIYSQQRPGLNEEIFTLYKFKSMTDVKNPHGDLLPDSERLTSFGRALRSTSLDELPELLNILKGDMSIVGPRPLLVQYLPLYNENQKRRHEVRPGLTGLAQVNGRNALSWEEKFYFDIKYVGNVSFIEDLKIILATVKKVLVKDGINSGSAGTMEAFTGNKQTADYNLEDLL